MRPNCAFSSAAFKTVVHAAKVAATNSSLDFMAIPNDHAFNAANVLFHVARGWRTKSRCAAGTFCRTAQLFTPLFTPERFLIRAKGSICCRNHWAIGTSAT